MSDAEIYADVLDLACDVADEDKAYKLIMRASSVIKSLCGGSPKDTDVAKHVCCSMVERALCTDSSTLGASQSSVTVGSYNQQWTWSNPSGDLYLTRDEKKMLGIGAYGVGFIEPRRHI